MTSRRGFTVAIAGCLTGAALVLVSVGLPWVRATSRASAPTPSRADAFLETTASYGARDAAPMVPPLGVLALAGVAALAGSRGRGRQAVGLVLAATGAAVVASAGRVLVDPAGVVVAPVTVTRLGVAPWLAVIGGAAVAAAGAGAVRRGRRWSALGPAYDAPSTVRRDDSDDLAAAWAAVEVDLGPDDERTAQPPHS